MRLQVKFSICFRYSDPLSNKLIVSLSNIKALSILVAPKLHCVRFIDTLRQLIHYSDVWDSMFSFLRICYFSYWSAMRVCTYLSVCR